MKENERYWAHLDESSKKAEIALLAYLTLLLTAGLLSFSGAIKTGDFVSIPLSQITLEKWNAIEIVLVLVFASLLRFISMNSYSKLLRFKLSQLEKRENEEDVLLYNYPSTLGFFEVTHNSLVTNRIYVVLGFLLLIIPIGIAIYIGIIQFEQRRLLGLMPLPFSWAISSLINLVLISLSVRALIVPLRLSIQNDEKQSHKEESEKKTS